MVVVVVVMVAMAVVVVVIGLGEMASWVRMLAMKAKGSEFRSLELMKARHGSVCLQAQLCRR